MVEAHRVPPGHRCRQLAAYQIRFWYQTEGHSGRGTEREWSRVRASGIAHLVQDGKTRVRMEFLGRCEVIEGGEAGCGEGTLVFDAGTLVLVRRKVLRWESLRPISFVVLARLSPVPSRRLIYEAKAWPRPRVMPCVAFRHPIKYICVPLPDFLAVKLILSHSKLPLATLKNSITHLSPSSNLYLQALLAISQLSLLLLSYLGPLVP